MFETILALLVWRAEVHGANVAAVARVARCENHNLIPGLISANGRYIGLGQWGRRGNAWYSTPAYTVLGIDIWDRYGVSDPDAAYYDADMLAWAFSPEAPRGFTGQWGCR